VQIPRSAEVAIIGGGFAGCATAWALARAGIEDVVVFERERELGRYASGRGAGLGRQLVEDDDTTALTVRGAAVLRGELAASWTASGGVLSFDDPARADAYLERARRFAVAVERIDRAAVVARWPVAAALPIACGLWVPGDGIIEIRRLLATYAERARIVLGAQVLGVTAGKVATSRGEVAARVVVDAGGPWAGMITGDEPLDAFKRHLAVLEVAPPDGASWWHLGDAEIYARGDAGGVLASPCDEVRGSPDDFEVAADGIAPVRALFDAPLRREWACVRSFTHDRRMRLGRDPRRPWLVWAAGLGGHGATASAAVGEIVARAVVDALS
jgi:glycine/D-amino acid oxidase-like deaminating enzyme